jgi:hypothetical protein
MDSQDGSCGQFVAPIRVRSLLAKTRHLAENERYAHLCRFKARGRNRFNQLRSPTIKRLRLY